MKTYQVIQHNEWSCPGMIIWVEDNKVIAIQQNADNSLTYYSDLDEREFDLDDYRFVVQVSDTLTLSVETVKDLYAKKIQPEDLKLKFSVKILKHLEL